MKHKLIGLAFAAALVTGTPSVSSAESVSDVNNRSVLVTVDQAKVFRVSRPANTIIIGNPSIVDATIQDDQTLILTGRSFGVTNLIVLDENGDALVDQPVVVQASEANTVRIYRRDSRATMACSPVCEPTLTIGDDNRAFDFASGQIQVRNQLSLSNSN
ncbi:MAG: pilus assembly protein N-terminal domain-containing protein [Rhizobiaceae bacterium]|nr:pilus assembly protein N-terminal domain-containing protein [Rhizobiaceae bacterium]